MVDETLLNPQAARFDGVSRMGNLWCGGSSVLRSCLRAGEVCLHLEAT